MFINEAFAAPAAVSGVGALGSTLVQIALILLIFYFLLIRPQQKRMKEHADMVHALKVDDEVVTSSGIYGKIAKIGDNIISLQIADGVIINIEAMAVSNKITPQSGAKSAVVKATTQRNKKTKK